MRNFLLTLALSELLALVQELPFLYFDNLIKLDPMIECFLDLCVHDFISGCMFHAVMVELYWCQLLCYLRGVQ
jgi:hypothetical protein